MLSVAQAVALLLGVAPQIQTVQLPRRSFLDGTMQSIAEKAEAEVKAIGHSKSARHPPNCTCRYNLVELLANLEKKKKGL